MARFRRSSSRSGPSLATPTGRRANRLSFTLTALASLTEAWTLISLGRSIGAALQGTPLPTGTLMTALICALLTALLHYTAQHIARQSAAHEESLLRQRLLRHLFSVGTTGARDHRSGASVSLLTDGTERIAQYRQTFLAPTIAAAASPALVLLLVAVTVDWLPALILLCAVVLVPVTIGSLHKKFRRASSGSRSQRTRLAAEYLDAIQGLTTLTLARAGERTAAELRQAGEDNRRAVMRLLAGNQVVIFLTDSLFSLFFVTVAIAAALLRLNAGAIDVGDALALALVSYVLLEPMDYVGAFFYVGMGGMANQRTARALLARRPAGISPAPGSTPPGDDDADATSQHTAESLHTSTSLPSSGSLPAPLPEHTAASQSMISLQDVTAQWEENSPAILDRISLSIADGENVAVTGPSGAGKSTLLAILAGELIPSRGHAVVGGTELRPETREQVREVSAVVAQSTWLFTGTIADNLRMAHPQASREDMWRALEDAGLADDIRAMPDGLDTRVGEQGLGLSGGQAQRVSLARAFLADRPLLILDEPTSQVDLASEAIMSQAITRLSQGRTVLTVSHRAGAVDSAHRHLTVADGRVTEGVSA